MGRLSPVGSRALRVLARAGVWASLGARRRAVGVPLVGLALGLGLNLCLNLCLNTGCDSSADAPAKSRVQAVMVEAEPGGSAEAPKSAAGASGSITPVAEPVARPAAPRAPLCEGQLDQKAQAFKPKRTPTQLSVDGDSTLPADPLKSGRKRWTWVNFWAAWCVPCREELPLLLGWQGTLAAELEFAFVSMDDDERQLREFLGRQPPGGLRQTHWLPDGAVRKAWLEALHLNAEPELPLQLLIDPEGKLRCQISGAVEQSDLQALQRIVKR